MSALTPVIYPLRPYSTALDSLINESLDELQTVTRSFMSSWRIRMAAAILKDGKNADEFVKAIRRWLSDCTRKDFTNFPASDVVDKFLEIQCFARFDTFSAKRLLANLQLQAEIDTFPQHQHQSHQHNLLEDLTTSVEDMSLEDLGLDNLDSEDELDNFSGLSQRDQAPLDSPPRKRKKTEVQIDTMAFHIYDALPIHARSPSKWNFYLKASPDLWPTKCADWADKLSAALKQTEVSDISEESAALHYTNVVNTLREIRQVQATVFRQDKWFEAVKASNLWKIVYAWSEPGGIVSWTASFAKSLARKHRIQDSLLLVMHNWIPETVRASWVLEVEAPNFSPNSNTEASNLGIYLYRVLTHHPDIIPREAFPSSVYFLLSAKNFYEAGITWLGYSLQKRNLNAGFLNSEETAQDAYSKLIGHITSFKSNELDLVKDKPLQIIFRRTIDFRKLKKKVKDKFLSINRKTLNSPCAICLDRPADERCIQKYFVDVKKLDNSWLGCGVSYSPREKIDAIQDRNSKAGSFEPRPVVHPKNDLGLKDIRCSPEILERCNSMTYFFCDRKNPDEILDFWTYGAFPKQILDRMISHHKELQSVKSVRRGKQFQEYSQGAMFPKGSRAAAGGIPGDAYTMYSGMEAVDEKSIEALFNDAEDCMFLIEAARIIHPPVFSKFVLQAVEGDKLGTTGATSYLCKNFASPLHRDDDICPGLCAQYELQAKTDGDEYGFIYGDYGIYVVSQSNSLWSFSGSTTHGTILPSTDPLGPQDWTPVQGGQPDDGGNWPPPRVSNGNHVTKTKRNSQAAHKYNQARQSRKQINKYWRS